MMDGADAAVFLASEGRGSRMLAASASSPSSAAWFDDTLSTQDHPINS